MHDSDRHHSRSKRPAGAVLAAIGIAAFLAPSPARAQTEMTIMYGGSEPTFSTEDLEALFGTISLSPDQAQIITGIHAGYAQAHRAVYNGVLEQAREIGEKISAQESEAIRRSLAEDRVFIRQAGREECRDLDINFTSDVKALLSESQMAQYHRFERDRRRSKTLRVGRVFQGESIDLVALAQTLDPGDHLTIAPTLDAYAVELDPILIHRNRVIDRLEIESMEPDVKVRADQHKASYQQSLPVHLAVRDLNWRWMDQVAGALDRTDSLDWQRRFFRAGWPNIIATTLADETFEKAARLLTLGQRQREVLEIMNNSFLEQITPVERQIVELEREYDRQNRMNPDDGAEASDRVNQLLDQRRKIVDDFINRVHGILSPAQKTELQSALDSAMCDDLAQRFDNCVMQYAHQTSRWNWKETA